MKVAMQMIIKGAMFGLAFGLMVVGAYILLGTLGMKAVIITTAGLAFIRSIVWVAVLIGSLIGFSAKDIDLEAYAKKVSEAKIA